MCRYASVRCEYMPDNKTEQTTQPYFSGNTIYNPAGKTGQCGMSLRAWQALGNDPGTTVHGPIPQPDRIVAMAAATLGLA